MPTEAKRETVAELREVLSGSRTLIVSEYRGLKVKEIAEIRRALRKQDVTYRVVKNRLMRIAAEDTLGEAPHPAAHRPDGDRLRERRVGDGQGGPRRDAAVPRSSASPAPSSGPGDRRRRRHAASPPCRPREVLLAELAGAHAGARSATLAGLFDATAPEPRSRWLRSATRRRSRGA